MNPASGDIVELVIMGTGPSEEDVVNTFHFELQSDPGGTYDLDAVCEGLSASIRPALFDVLSEQYTYVKSVLNVVTGVAKGDQGQSINDAGTNGDQTGEALPIEMCLSFKRKCRAVGRAFRGRIFVSPIVPGWLLNPLSSDSTVDVTNGQLTTLAAAIKGQRTVLTVDYLPVLFHTADQTSNEITRTEVGPSLVHRRSRRLRAPN